MQTNSWVKALAVFMFIVCPELVGMQNEANGARAPQPSGPREMVSWPSVPGELRVDEIRNMVQQVAQVVAQEVEQNSALVLSGAVEATNVTIDVPRLTEAAIQLFQSNGELSEAAVNIIRNVVDGFVAKALREKRIRMSGIILLPVVSGACAFSAWCLFSSAGSRRYPAAVLLGLFAIFGIYVFYLTLRRYSRTYFLDNYANKLRLELETALKEYGRPCPLNKKIIKEVYEMLRAASSLPFAKEELKNLIARLNGDGF